MTKKIKMRFRFTSILLIISLHCLCVNCQRNKDSKTGYTEFVETLFRAEHIKPETVRNIFILSERGCIGCNSAYLDFIVHNVINHPESMIYSTASGTRLDISPFLNDTVNNYYKGDIQLLKEYDLSLGSYYVRYVEHKTDTVILITVENVRKTIEYMAEKSQ